MSQRFSDDEKELIKELLINETYLEISRQINERFNTDMNDKSIDNQINKNRVLYGDTQKKKEIITEEIEKAFIITSANNRKKILNEYMEVLKEIKESVEKESKQKSPKKKIESSSEKEALVLMLSDLHIGKKVLGYDGTVLYDTDIAIKYLREITNRLKNVMSHAGKGTQIDEIVILLIGDLVESENIFPTQNFHLDIHASEQVRIATKILWELIVELSEMKGIEKVSVIGARGNHGRTLLGHESTNWDNICHNNLYLLNEISDNDKIEISKTCEEYNIANIKGHKILIRHHAPVQADTPSAKSKFAGWIDIHNADAVCYGHWHHVGVNIWNDRYIFRNGSLPGSDDLAERIAVHNAPCQLCFGVSKKRLPTFIYPLTFEEGSMF